MWIDECSLIPFVSVKCSKNNETKTILIIISILIGYYDSQPLS